MFFRTLSSRTLHAAATAARSRVPRAGASAASTMAGSGARSATSSSVFASSSLRKSVGLAGTLLSLGLYARLQQSARSEGIFEGVTPDTSDVDEVYNKGDYQRTLDLLHEQFSESEKEHFEWLWRKARSLYGIATSDEVINTPEKAAKVNEAFELIEKAMEQEHSSNDVHRWYGILLNEFNSQKGTKAKILTLPKVKESWEEAVRLNPKDATSYHLLGRWSKGLMEIGWTSRQIAYRIFGALPETSYKEAHRFFKAAEDIQPGFWLNNKLQLAQVCLKMSPQRKEEAKKHLLDALKIEVVTDEDRESMIAVENLLKQWEWWPEATGVEKK